MCLSLVPDWYLFNRLQRKVLMVDCEMLDKHCRRVVFSLLLTCLLADEGVYVNIFLYVKRE